MTIPLISALAKLDAGGFTLDAFRALLPAASAALLLVLWLDCRQAGNESDPIEVIEGASGNQNVSHQILQSSVLPSRDRGLAGAIVATLRKLDNQ